MLDRIRRAKAELIPEGVPVAKETFHNVAYCPLSFIATKPELGDIAATLEAVLAESRRDPRNIEPYVGFKHDAIASLLKHLQKLLGQFMAKP
jgi:hypothetical protein